jgi:hypothetical protein
VNVQYFSLLELSHDGSMAQNEKFQEKKIQSKTNFILKMKQMRLQVHQHQRQITKET